MARTGKDTSDAIDPLKEERTMYAKRLLLILLLIAAAGTAAADPFSAKPRHAGRPAAASPGAARAGGETIETATVIPALPYTDSGTTIGALNDYDEACPFEGSLSPDVVYAYTPAATGPVEIDLCDSGYDTKVYVYDDTLELVACNDDFYVSGDPTCWPYASKIEYLELSGLTTYYIVIDGYDDDAGDYVLSVDTASPYDLECRAGIRPEGEPPLQNGTTDLYNSGCSGGPLNFQELAGGLDGTVQMCVKSGWRLGVGVPDFDTDWMAATVGPTGLLHCQYDADWTTIVYATTAVGCWDVSILGSSRGGRGAIGELEVAAEPGTLVWLYILPSSATPPTGATPYEYDLDLTVTGLEPTPAVNEDRSWGAVKSLYR
jgi:hypothetical protein